MTCVPNEDSGQPGHRPVWSESALSPWRSIGSLTIGSHKANSEDSDQTGWMPRLIWVTLLGGQVFLLVSVMLRLICFTLITQKAHRTYRCILVEEDADFVFCSLTLSHPVILTHLDPLFYPHYTKAKNSSCNNSSCNMKLFLTSHSIATGPPIGLYEMNRDLSRDSFRTKNFLTCDAFRIFERIVFLVYNCFYRDFFVPSYCYIDDHIDSELYVLLKLMKCLLLECFDRIINWIKLPCCWGSCHHGRPDWI